MNKIQRLIVSIIIVYYQLLSPLLSVSLSLSSSPPMIKWNVGMGGEDEKREKANDKYPQLLFNFPSLLMIATDSYHNMDQFGKSCTM